MDKCRVLHVCNQLELGGAEKALQVFCKNLDMSRFEVFACGRMSGVDRIALLEWPGILKVQWQNIAGHALKVGGCM